MPYIHTAAICLILGLLPPIASQAHNLEAEVSVKEIGFTVRAFFEDGTPTRNATAEVIASDGDVLAAGKTDDRGEFSFSNDLKEKIEVVVEDDTGHRETFPLSPAAIALAIKGEATKMEHSHGEGEHDHTHDHDENGEHSHEGDHTHDSDATDQGDEIILRNETAGNKSSRVISGLGYVLGITGILFYFLGMKQKAGA